ncbi:hypothetical protein KR222_000112 [Zaprionus bogoriensis]|nr:hypothetical protein KR222_000112 [Zaprionus bogoriensis]
MVFHALKTDPCGTRHLSSSNSSTSQQIKVSNIEPVISRTPLLILDYVQFLAARTIQRHWRGFANRQKSWREWHAAVTIQRWWRGFYVRRMYVKKLEDRLQKTLLDHYNKSATMIQALFRGWWIRQTVHDVYALHRMQACAAADLLNCVACKLHYLMRTYSIPGVYSLRHSRCLSRVEKLLASINYRFHNQHVAIDMLSRQATVNAKRQQFRDAKFATNVPYNGPNYKGICKPHCEEFMRKTKDMDRRMFTIISAYDKSLVDTSAKKVHSSLIDRRRRRQLRLLLEKRDKRRSTFCADVIASMRRWKMLDGRKLTIAKDVFRDPENLEKFLNDVSEIVELMDGKCHCKIIKFDEIECHK